MNYDYESFPYIPNELIHIILEYDGRIKYKKGQYINIIHKKDERYTIIRPVIIKKMKIMETIELDGSKFYFEFAFDSLNNSVGLCYDFNFSYEKFFEICYYDVRYDWKQIRTFID
jgi:hypothetical protein